jgi:uncharacterized protein (DUF983 family)
LRWFLRALALRCPLCGKPWPHRGWLHLVSKCPSCDLHLGRKEHDAFLGAYTIALFASLMVAVVATVALVIWSAGSGSAGMTVAVVLITAFAIVFYPISQLLWLAFDLQFRPPIEGDFDDEEDVRTR